MLSYFFSFWLCIFSLFLLWCTYLLLRVSLCSRTIVSSFRFALFLLHQWSINFFRFTYLFSFLHWQRVLWHFILSFVFALVLPLLFYEPSYSLLCAIASSFRVLFLLHHWFIYIFLFLLSICFLVLTKVTTASLSVVWIFAMSYLLHCCCHRYCCLRVYDFNFFLKLNKNAAIYHSRSYKSHLRMRLNSRICKSSI